MENLYGPGTEGPPHSAEECEEGELSPGVGLGRQEVVAGVGGTGGVDLSTEHWPPEGCLPPEEVDMLLQRCEGGVDAALQYAKDMARYMKDLISYLEKRTALGESRETPGGQGGGGGLGKAVSKPHSAPHPLVEMEFAKGLQKVVHNCRQSVTHEVGRADQAWEEGCVGGRQARLRPPPPSRASVAQSGCRALGPLGPPPGDQPPPPAPQPHMPLLSIYSLALEQDLEFGHGMVQAVGTLQTQTFMQVGCDRSEVACGLGAATRQLGTHGLFLPPLAPDPAAVGA